MVVVGVEDGFDLSVCCGVVVFVCDGVEVFVGFYDVVVFVSGGSC